MKKYKAAFLLCTAMLLIGCTSKDTTNNKASNTDILDINSETDDKMLDNKTYNTDTSDFEPLKSTETSVELNEEKYIEAIKWILNPNAGPNYWEETYYKYSDYIDRNLLDSKIQEYWDNGGIDTSGTGMSEPEYNMRYTYQYPKYVDDVDYGIFPENTSTYDGKNTLSFDEYCKQIENIDYIYFTRFYKCQDRNYVYTDISNPLTDYQKEISGLMESFEIPYWDLEISSIKDGEIILQDNSVYDRYKYLGKTLYTLTLNKDGKISDIDTYYDANSELEIEFDWKYYQVFDEYPDDNKLTNRIIANDNLIEKYRLDELQDILVEEASQYWPHPILTASIDYGDYLMLTMENPYFEAVYEDEPQYVEYVMLVHVDGRHQVVFSPNTDFESVFQ